MVHADPDLEQSLIKIEIFFGIKRPEGFFETLGLSRGVKDPKKVKNKKKSTKNSWLHISAKKRLLFGEI